MGLYENLRDSNFPYSPTVVKDLINSNLKRYGYIKPLTKRIIFFMMRRIVLRGVSTFLNINKNRSNDTVYNTEDMASEIYLVLDKCVDKFDTEMNKDFYLYFSSSVSRRMSRMANYKKINNNEISFTKYGSQVSDDEDVLVEELLEDKKVSKSGEGEFLDYVDSINWSETQKGVLESLKNGRNIMEILRENGITKKEHKEIMESIREELLHNELMEGVMLRLNDLWTKEN